jgi:hypothetical protein
MPSYALPALKGMGSIVTSSEEVVDNSFASKLERSGQLESALLEWLRVYHNGGNSSRKELASFKAGEINCKLQRYNQCLESFKSFGAEYPKSTKIPEALYMMSVAADQAYAEKGHAFRERLIATYAESDWAEKAWYLFAWKNAEKGKTTLAHGFDSIKKLNKNVQDFNKIHADTPRLAGSFAAIPGVGHIYLGDMRTGLMAIIHIMLFGYAVLYAVRRKHWPYAVIFGLVLGILYVGSIFSAYSLAKREIQEQRLIDMKQWDNKDNIKISAKLNPAVSPLESMFWYQRNVIGKFDGERGNGYPVNSLYAKQAMQEFGSSYGLLMTVDRLLRDWREIERPLTRIYADNRSRYVDTLKRNTFWMYDE